MAISRYLMGMFFSAVAGAAIMPTAIDLAPVIEGRWAPVAGPARIVDIHREEDGWTYFSMAAPKLRACSWRSTLFYLGNRRVGAGTFAPFEHLDRPEEREVGELFWAKNRTRLTPEQLIENSFADTYHQCPGWLRFWQTKTEFYH